MSFTFKIRDTGELDRFRRAFPTMATRAVNRVAQSVAEEAKRTILANYNVTPDALDANITVYEAKVREGDLTAKIIAKGQRLPATMFAPQATAHGTSIEIRKGVRREIIGAFVATTTRGYGRKGGQSKKIRKALATIKYQASTATYQAARALMRASGMQRASVFIRKGKSRLPIREVSGTSVANLFSSGIVTQALNRYGKTAIARELRAEINEYQARAESQSRKAA
jgi:hypothetical protein